MSKDHLSIEVAKLYYKLNLSQQEIAQQLAISRPSVSRLLQYAKEKGYVKVDIIDPFTETEQLEKALKAKYQIDQVAIALSALDEETAIMQAITSLGAEVLNRHMTNNKKLGISWGKTMYQLAQKLHLKPLKNVEVVQLKGGVSHSNVPTYGEETVQLFAQAFTATSSQLPLPVILDNPLAKKLVEQDRHIKSILTAGKQCDVAIFTVGTVRDEALLFRLGYLSQKEKRLLQEQAVGDICSRFFSAQGEIAVKEVDAKTIGAELSAIQKIPQTILVAGGKHKVAAINGALVGNYVKILVTDQFTARKLLEQNF